MTTANSSLPTMESNPRRWIAALRSSQDRLRSLVLPLSGEQVRGPSYHDWAIAQVMSHLGSQAELFMGWLTAALTVTKPAGRDAMRPVWDAWNARSPDEQVKDSLSANERLVERLEALTGDELARMRLNLFGMDLDATGLLRLRLAEHALHTWDIAVALDPKAQVSPDAVTLLIDTLGALAGRAGKPQGKTFRLRIQTTEPERNLSLRVADAVEITPWTEGPVDGELRIPAEALLRLVYGRLDDEHTPALELTGPVTLDDLRGVFSGF